MEKKFQINASTGSVIWNYYANGGGVESSPAVVSGKVYVGNTGFNFYCLDASTGSNIWNYTTGLAVFSSPAVANGKVT